MVSTCTAALTPASPSGADDGRPNVLWITSEDNTQHFVRLFDPMGAPMPNVEGLAKEGLVFERAFSNAPVCSPARSAIISGCYGPRVGAQWHRHAALAPMPTGLRMFPWYLGQAGYYTSNNVKTDYNLGDSGIWNDSSAKASWRGRAPGQPFFHVQNFTTTHESSLHLNAAELSSVALETDPAAVRLFPFHPDTPEFRRTYALYHDRHRLLDRQIGELLDRLRADGLLDETIVFYFGDNGGAVPGTKGYAHNVGMHVPMVVWFPPKWRHLAPAAAGTRLGGFVSFVDLAPTVLRLAGLPAPPGIDGRPFLGAGVTAADLAARDEAFGYADRFDERYDLVRTLRKGRFQYTRNYLPFQPESVQNNYRYKMVAFEQWRTLHRGGNLPPVQDAFFMPRAPEGLYDLASDPFELHNLAGDPAHATVLHELRERLRGWVKGMPDLGFLPENVFVAQAAADPVRYGQAHAAEIGRLVDIVDLSLQPFGEVGARLEAILREGAPLERYWALAACAAFGREAISLVPLAMHSAEEDTNPLVRVRAAEFLVLAGGHDPVPVINKALRAATDPLEAALMLNSVAWLQERDPSLVFGVDASWFPSAWTRHPVLGARLEYLGALRVRPSNPAASSATLEVLGKLRALGWDAGALSGHRVGDASNPDAGRVHHALILDTTSGLAPAFREASYVDHATGRVEWEEGNRLLLGHWRRGGMVGVRIPLGNPVTGGHRRDTSVRPDLVGLTRPGGEGHERFIRDLDAIADGLTQLRDAGVAVLFRPFHEANGDWFWWGARDPEAFRELWKFAFRHLVETRKLDNLLWVYGPGDGDGAMRFYPGERWVDVLGYSISHQPLDRARLSDLDAMLATGKPVGVTEIELENRGGPGDGNVRELSAMDAFRQAFPEAAFISDSAADPGPVVRHRDSRNLEWLRRRAGWRVDPL